MNLNSQQSSNFLKEVGVSIHLSPSRDKVIFEVKKFDTMPLFDINKVRYFLRAGM